MTNAGGVIRGAGGGHYTPCPTDGDFDRLRSGRRYTLARGVSVLRAMYDQDNEERIAREERLMGIRLEKLANKG